MESPNSGLRRATVASWALTGIGVAGVAAASALAYADTLKPVAETSTQTAGQRADDGGAASTQAVDVPVVIPTPVPPPPPPPVTSEPAVPRSTPTQSAEDAPAVVRKPAASAPSTTKTAPAPSTTRRINTPTIVQSPKYSPSHISVSRGS